MAVLAVDLGVQTAAERPAPPLIKDFPATSELYARTGEGGRYSSEYRELTTASTAIAQKHCHCCHLLSLRAAFFEKVTASQWADFRM
jgi:hypothetical protein